MIERGVSSDFKIEMTAGADSGWIQGNGHQSAFNENEVDVNWVKV